MVVLDATVVNIALPSAQSDLGFADSGRQWIVTAYALAFGALLLLGPALCSGPADPTPADGDDSSTPDEPEPDQHDDHEPHHVHHENSIAGACRTRGV
jgi:hypothetical protein